MLLGVGGVRAIRACCWITGAPPPAVFHSRGAGFAGWNGFAEYMQTGDDFDTALERSRAGTIFYTCGSRRHRPVPSRADRSAVRGLVSLPLDRVLALGAEDYQGR